MCNVLRTLMMWMYIKNLKIKIINSILLLLLNKIDKKKNGHQRVL